MTRKQRVHDRLPPTPVAPVVWCREDPVHGEHIWRRIGRRYRNERFVLVLQCADCSAEWLRR